MGQFVFKLPDLGEGTVESEIVEWYVKPGEIVVQDQHIADVMTDKANVELTSPVAGVVVSVAGDAGDIVAVGAELIRFDVEGEGNAATAEAAIAIAETPVADVAPTAPVVEEAASVADGRFVFKLPDLGEGTVESEVAEWHVAVGDVVAQDQVIADVMTDKATVELTAPVAGTVVSLAGAAGDVIAVGSELISFAVAGGGNAPSVEAVTPVVAAPAAKPAAPQVPKVAPAASLAPQVMAPVAASGEVLASPAVRRRALDADIDLTIVPSTGPAGRVQHEDLDNFIAAGGKLAIAAASSGRQRKTGTTEIPVRGLRRMIAQKMQQSKRQIPHFTYVEEVDVTELEALRQHMNTTRTDDQPKLTLLAYIMQAVARVMGEFPQFNATFDDTNNVITRYEGVHLGVAAQTDDGLKVPVVKHAEALDVWGLANEMKRVSDAAKNNTATKDVLTGGSLTITSLGPLGGLVHTPVINYPEVAIIGTNNMVERPVVRNGDIVVRKMMNLSSSFDHRVIDGYDAAQMIQRVRQLLEHPGTLFI